MGRVVNRVLEACVRREQVRVERACLGINEYIYVKDAARAIALACQLPNLSGTFNIGCGALHTCDEFLGEVKGIFPDPTITIVSSNNPTVAYLTRDQPFDVARAKRDLGFQAKFPLRAGLQDYVAELVKFMGSYPRLD